MSILAANTELSPPQLARESGLAYQAFLPLGPERYMILPWVGSRLVLTQIKLLEQSGLTVAQEACAFYYAIRDKGGTEALKAQFVTIAATPFDPVALAQNLPRAELELHKFDRYIPDNLLQQAYNSDYLDLEGATQSLYQMARA